MTVEQLVMLRRQQVGAAIGALDLDGFMIEPLMAVFAPELLQHVSLGSTLAQDRLKVGTRAAGENASVRVLKLLEDVYEANDDLIGLVGALCAWNENGVITIAVTEARGGSEPALAIGFPGKRSRADLWEGLAVAEVNDDLKTKVDRMAGKLRQDAFVDLVLHLDQPHASPRIEVSFPFSWTSAEVEIAQGQLDLVYQEIEVPDPMRTWASQTYGSLSPRPRNNTPVTVATTREQLLPTASVAYPDVPSQLLLRLMTQFVDDPLSGTRLGAIAAAAGAEDDIVSSVHVGVTTTNDPAIQFEFQVEGPPPFPSGL